MIYSNDGRQLPTAFCSELFLFQSKRKNRDSIGVSQPKKRQNEYF